MKGELSMIWSLDLDHKRYPRTLSRAMLSVLVGDFTQVQRCCTATVMSGRALLQRKSSLAVVVWKSFFSLGGRGVSGVEVLGGRS